MRRSRIFNFCLAVIILFLIIPAATFASETDDNEVLSLTEDQIEMMEESVERSMADGRIPGVALIITSGSEIIYSQGFGYADVRNRDVVTMDTVFEIASNSKAFTGLAILQLESEGLIDLSAPVTQYIPWLEMNYNGEATVVTIDQFMSHRSGIPFASIELIPESTADDALEQTVRTLVGLELQTEPGEAYSYATLNYTILGLVIENISGQSFEEYIVENVLNPIGLGNTHMFHEDAGDLMSTGYKINFLRARVYDAPIYRGNKPAGYILSSGNDMALFMMTQLGFNDASTFDQSLITRSHEFGMPLEQGGEVSYMVGWFVNEFTGEITHAGTNPNFSSFITLDPENGIGVTVLSNMASPFTPEIMTNVVDIVQGSEPQVLETVDMNLEFDRIAVVIVFISIIIMGLIMFLFTKIIKQIKAKQRAFAIPKLSGIIGLCILLVFLVILAFLLFNLPRLLMGVGWGMAVVWAPVSLLVAAIFLWVAIFSVCLYITFDTLYKRKDGMPLFFTTLVSIIAGFGNAMIVFMINEALRGDFGLQFTILFFFVLGITLYAGGSRIVRAKLIKVTNHMIYKLRMDLINKILNTPLESVEKLDDGVIQSTLNNDTEVVSTFPNLIINMITASTTMVACFIYLGFINIFTLLTAIVTIVVIASIYFVVIQSSNKLLEEARTTQNMFFKFINDIASGFKELRLNIRRRRAFEDDVDELSDTYNQKVRRALLSFADAFVVGELVFTLAIGFIVFIFPLIFGNLRPVDLRSYVFILLFLVGPVNGILGTIPNLVQIKVAWGRINKLHEDISKLAEEAVSIDIDENKKPVKMSLTLKDVEYEYASDNDEKFKIGPLSCKFDSGEVTFITGGNGSGKSTLAKIITGLYRSGSGEILLNDEPISAADLEQKYAAIFGDFHLFDKLYGIDYEEKKEEFEKYMEIMQLDDKTKLEDGRFSTTELSTGQRKRLALVVSYLEDRPICLFDEWAADQDPEFREFFYKDLIPELKERGKCIIAITHDDRYFDYADRLIKMEWGQIVDY